MSRARAFDVAIAFGLNTGSPCQPKLNGEGYDALIPMEWLEGIGIASGCLEPRPPLPKPRPTAVYKDRV